MVYSDPVAMLADLKEFLDSPKRAMVAYNKQANGIVTENSAEVPVVANC